MDNSKSIPPAGTEAKKRKSSKTGGVPANYILIPLIIIFLLLYGCVMWIVYNVNKSSSDLADLMTQTRIHQEEATDLMAGASILSETSTSVVVKPILEDGTFNVGPLKTYANELSVNRRGPDIAARFMEFDVSANTKLYITTASNYAEYLVSVQIHALSLIRSIYSLPPIPVLDNIPTVELTAAELAMTNEERLEYANNLMLGSDYGQIKSKLNQSVTNCNNSLQEDFVTEADATSERIAKLRSLLWVLIIAIAALTTCGFVLLYSWLIIPLNDYVQLIHSDSILKKRGGVAELRLVASAYNDLLHRRAKLERILRSAAETDALTGLFNRYGLARYWLENGDSGKSLAIVLFDINYLKKVNDRDGHLAGDKLILDAGNCICECFGQEKNENCYRIGGDEFVAVLRDCGEDEVKKRVERFAYVLERENISVSYGYSYAETTDEDSLNALMDEADKRMYEQKKQTHSLVKTSKGA